MREREVLESCVLETSPGLISLELWKALFSCLWRHRWEADLSLSLSRVTCSVSRNFHSLFIPGVSKFHNDMALWVGFFFLSHQLCLTLRNSNSMKFLQLFLWKLSFSSFYPLYFWTSGPLSGLIICCVFLPCFMSPFIYFALFLSLFSLQVNFLILHWIDFCCHV